MCVIIHFVARPPASVIAPRDGNDYSWLSDLWLACGTHFGTCFLISDRQIKSSHSSRNVKMIKTVMANEMWNVRAEILLLLLNKGSVGFLGEFRHASHPHPLINWLPCQGTKIILYVLWFFLLLQILHKYFSACTMEHLILPTSCFLFIQKV